MGDFDKCAESKLKKRHSQPDTIILEIDSENLSGVYVCGGREEGEWGRDR